jgi:hypothetical protein
LIRASLGEAPGRLAETPADLARKLKPRSAAVAARRGLPGRRVYARALALAGARR